MLVIQRSFELGGSGLDVLENRNKKYKLVFRDIFDEIQDPDGRTIGKITTKLSKQWFGLKTFCISTFESPYEKANWVIKCRFSQLITLSFGGAISRFIENGDSVSVQHNGIKYLYMRPNGQLFIQSDQVGENPIDVGIGMWIYRLLYTDV